MWAYVRERTQVLPVAAWTVAQRRTRRQMGCADYGALRRGRQERRLRQQGGRISRRRRTAWGGGTKDTMRRKSSSPVKKRCVVPSAAAPGGAPPSATSPPHLAWSAGTLARPSWSARQGLRAAGSIPAASIPRSPAILTGCWVFFVLVFFMCPQCAPLASLVDCLRSA